MDTTPDNTLPAVIPCAAPTAQFLYDLALGPSRNANTRRSYARTLGDFASFLQAPDAVTALKALLEHPQGTANAVVSAYRNNLAERGMSPASISNRIGALRSIVNDARRFGLVPWTLDVKVGKTEVYRDTRGPGLEGVRKMLAEVETCDNEAKRARDRFIIRILYELGLRRNELASLDMADVDFVHGTIDILGKGRTSKETLTVPPKSMQAMKDWIAHRGTFDGPLVVNLDRACQNASSGRRLSGEGLRLIVAGYGEKAGLGKVRTHSLRHSSITEALNAFGGDVRTVMRHSRHKSVNTLLIYDDRRRDAAGEIARRLSEGL